MEIIALPGEVINFPEDFISGAFLSNCGAVPPLNNPFQVVFVDKISSVWKQMVLKDGQRFGMN